MKIAFIVNQFPVLSETFILNQITGLIDRGHEVDIYADEPSDNSKMHPDVENYRLLERTYYARRPPNPFLWTSGGFWLLLTNATKAPLVLLRSLNIFKYGKQAASFRLLYWVIPFFCQRSYDIIHCHFGQNGLKASRLREIGALEGKLITTYHGVDITRDLQLMGDHIYDSLFKTGDLFLPISKYWQSRLIELGCNKQKIIVHRMGIDCRKFYFIPRQTQTDGSCRLVMLSRLVEKKGVEYSIRAVAKLANNRNIKYSVIGDGPLRESLQQLIQELNVSDIVKLLGWKQQQEIVEILNNSDILLAPSVTSKDGDQEGIPIAMMEAMAMGLPVVSTQHSGIPELVQDGISGFLVRERDVDALTEKLGYLIDHPEVWSEMGQAGRAYVEEHYNLDKLNDQLVETYQRLLN